MQTQRKPKVGDFYTYDHGDYSNLALCYYYDQHEIRFIEYDTGGDNTLYFNKINHDWFNKGYIIENPYNRSEYWFDNFFDGMKMLLNKNQCQKCFSITDLEMEKHLIKEAFVIFKTRNHIGNSYSDYLQTIQWKRIRNRKLDKFPYCQECGVTDNLEIHHLTYTHVGDEENHMEDLMVLCHNCHTRFHNKY